MIRVLHIANMIKGSGVASMIMNYFRHIDRSKVTFDFLSDNLSGNTYEEEINALGGKLHKAPYYKYNFGAYVKFLNNIIKPDVYDIVHCHEFVLSIVALAIAKKNRVRHSHSHSHIHAQKGELFSVMKEIMVFLVRPFFRLLSTNCFACSKDAGMYLFGKSARFEIIHNAIAVEKYVFNRRSRVQTRNDLHISDTTVLIGYVARFDKQKNHVFLIKIFLQILETKKDSMLLLIGDGPEYQYIYDMAAAYGITEKIIFYGISNTVAGLYQAMDVFVFPSLAEGLGIVGIEAQCSGLPVVASTNIPREMQVSDLVTWLDLNDGADTWADKIIKCASKTARENMAEIIARAGYDISLESRKFEQKYIDLFRIKI